jgi:methionyl-tRNA synthetase
LIPAGHQIEAELLFAKIEDEEIQKQIDKLEATKTANKKRLLVPAMLNHRKKPFNLRILPKWIFVQEQSWKPKNAESKQAFNLKVDTGIDVRTIVSGIAESFKPEDIIEKDCFSEFGSKKPSWRGKSRNDFDDYEC